MKIIKYLKNEMKLLPLILVLCVVLYGLFTLATNHLFTVNKSKPADDSSPSLPDTGFQHTTDYNNLDTRLDGIENLVGSGTLNTTVPDLTGAINELNVLKGRFKARQTGTFSAKTTKTVTVPNGSDHIVIITGANLNSHGVYIVLAGTTGTVYLQAAKAASEITTSKTTNSVTFTGTSSSSATLYLYDICLLGDFLA